MFSKFKIGDTVRLSEKSLLEIYRTDRVIYYAVRDKYKVSGFNEIKTDSDSTKVFLTLERCKYLIQDTDLELASRAETLTEEVKKEPEPLYKVGDIVCFTDFEKRDRMIGYEKYLEISRDDDWDRVDIINLIHCNHTISSVKYYNKKFHYIFKEPIGYEALESELELVKKVEEEQIKQAPDMKVLTIADKFQLTDKAYREICATLVEGYEEDFDKQKLTHTEYQNHIKTCFTRLRMISSFNGANTIASYGYNGSVKTYTDQDGVEYPESSIVKVEE